jgi:hypothetical protein
LDGLFLWTSPGRWSSEGGIWIDDPLQNLFPQFVQKAIPFAGVPHEGQKLIPFDMGAGIWFGALTGGAGYAGAPIAAMASRSAGITSLIGWSIPAPLIETADLSFGTQATSAKDPSWRGVAERLFPPMASGPTIMAEVFIFPLNLDTAALTTMTFPSF